MAVLKLSLVSTTSKPIVVASLQLIRTPRSRQSQRATGRPIVVIFRSPSRQSVQHLLTNASSAAMLLFAKFFSSFIVAIKTFSKAILHTTTTPTKRPVIVCVPQNIIKVCDGFSIEQRAFSHREFDAVLHHH